MQPLVVQLFCLVLVIPGIRGQVPQGCENRLDELNTISASTEDNQVWYNFIDCEDLFINLPELCDQFGGIGGRCCEVCWGYDGNCVDTRLYRWVFNERIMVCADYVEQDVFQPFNSAGTYFIDYETGTCFPYRIFGIRCFQLKQNGDPCHCEDVGVSQKCCESCSQADMSECTCQDKLSPSSPASLTLGGQQKDVDSCRELVRYYSALCMPQQYGGDGNDCCISCKAVDVNCVDQLTAFDGQLCHDYVKQDPCRCDQIIRGMDVKQVCCHSCADIQVPDNCCVNRVSAAEPLVFPDPVTGQPLSLTSCDELERYHMLCEHDEVSGEFGKCCDKCKDIEDGCFDDPTTRIAHNGEQYNCAEFIALDDPCNCALVDVNLCCRSCEGKDISRCNCRDRVSADEPLVVTVGEVDHTFTSCTDLSPDHLDLCKTLAGEGNRCCETCDGVDTRCMDNSLAVWTTPDGVDKNCSSYIGTDLCNCDRTIECCMSCKGVSTRGCSCYDAVSDVYPLTLHSLEGTPVGIVTLCEVLIIDYPSQCQHATISGIGGRCCQACKAIKDPLCLNADVLFTLNGAEYDCEQLVEFSDCFCADTFQGVNVGTACCDACKKKKMKGCECRDILHIEAPHLVRDLEGEVIATLTSCAELIERFPEECLTAGENPGGVCCQRCKAIRKPHCLDLLSEERSLILSNGVDLTSCEDLRAEYPELCREHSGNQSRCCMSCRGAKTDCLDTRLKMWVLDAMTYDCEAWVDLDPCHCQDASLRFECCKACKKAEKILERIDCNCRNILSPLHQATVTMEGTGEVIPITSCSNITDFFFLCRQEEFSYLCCPKCKDYEQRCFDDNVAFSGGTQSCAEFVAEDNCRCAITEGDMMINTTCCQSCKKVSVKGCDCQDTLTPEHRITMVQAVGRVFTLLTSCEQVKEWMFLCAREDVRTLCCRACKNYETRCYDENVAFNEGTQSCADYIAEDKCNCALTVQEYAVAEVCCKSCKNKETEHCDCRNLLTPEDAAYFVLAVGPALTHVTDCQQMSDFPFLCADPYYIEICCKSCANRGDCYDGNVVFNAGTQTCAEFVAADYCNCDIIVDGVAVQEACCKSCKGIKEKDLKKCDCRDLLTPAHQAYTILAVGSTFSPVTACSQLVELPFLCRQDGFVEACCKTCRSILRSHCYDDNVAFNNGTTSCSDLVADDYCHCAGTVEGVVVEEACCLSCKGITKKDLNKCQCRDMLTVELGASVILALGGVQEQVTSCDQIQLMPFLCKDDDFRHLCCKQCKIYEDRCYDDNVAFRGGSVTCAELVEEDRCHCEMEMQGHVIAEACCKSCKGKSIDNCGCRNLLQKGPPIVMSDGSNITECYRLRNKYPHLCTEYGQERGLCCAACLDVDKTCYDDDTASFMYPSFPGPTYSCAAWVSHDHCHCLEPETKARCCHSCALIVPQDCGCRDQLSLYNPLRGNVLVSGVMATVSISSCAQLAQQYPEKCLLAGGYGRPCCKSCPDICSSDPAWLGTISMTTEKVEAGVLECVDCTCDQVAATHKSLVKKGCCKNSAGYRDSCCAHCTQWEGLC